MLDGRTRAGAGCSPDARRCAARVGSVADMPSSAQSPQSPAARRRSPCEHRSVRRGADQHNGLDPFPRISSVGPERTCRRPMRPPAHQVDGPPLGCRDRRVARERIDDRHALLAAARPQFDDPRQRRRTGRLSASVLFCGSRISSAVRAALTLVARFGWRRYVRSPLVHNTTPASAHPGTAARRAADCRSAPQPRPTQGVPKHDPVSTHIISSTFPRLP